MVARKVIYMNDKLAGQQCPHGQCCHGMCLDHDPEWEKVGVKRHEPNPGVFGKKTYWLVRHCEKPMARYKVVQSK